MLIPLGGICIKEGGVNVAITRRTFLKRAGASGLAATAILSGSKKAYAAINNKEEYATIIDLRKCDGCTERGEALCVLACRNKNTSRFPQPEKPIKNYWPQKKHEDWSDRQEITNQLTPYNWTYIQNIELEYKGVNKKVYIPRRCMHCDKPACSALCPFGVNDKMPEGPVVIDLDTCFGGAKCRDVCPWEIPQRQAGVGIYQKFAPTFAGGGVMYKCDLCYNLIKNDELPSCVKACPNEAIYFGSRQDVMAKVEKEAGKENVFIYGLKENGGTSTIYVSDIPFELIDEELNKSELDGKPGKPGMPVGIESNMESGKNYSKAMLIAPFAGIMAAGLTIYKGMKGDEKHEDNEA